MKPIISNLHSGPEIPHEISNYCFEKGKPIQLVEDGITTLMLENAASASDILISGDWNEKETGKNLYSRGWTSIAQHAEWIVNANIAIRCEVRVLVECNGGEWTLSIGGRQIAVQCPGRGFQRIEVGEIDLAKGESQVSLKLSSVPNGNEALFKSIEIVTSETLAGLKVRAAALRSDTSWMREAKYGVMTQWGAWGYPRHGDKTPWPQMFEHFNIESFARMVDEEMGAAWVIWSLTWRGSRFPMPMESVDSILPGYTLKTDFIGALADALNRRGIRLMLYYHPGHADPEFWRNNWSDAGRADRTRFFENWLAIVTEIGARYGTRLSGWFFDDGCVYYPAPFEIMTKAAKSGNPERLVSYNNWKLPLYTEFQDIMMGEEIHEDRNLLPNGNGIYTSGSCRGQQSHGMFCIDGPDWGIWKPDTNIVPAFTAEKTVNAVKDAIVRGMPLSLNFLMYEDGTVSSESLQTLRAVKNAVHVKKRLPQNKSTILS